MPAAMITRVNFFIWAPLYWIITIKLMAVKDRSDGHLPG
ncbi:MAG: hypothetical protein OP8BY_1427 [Candidatus Saccharicenans subterraneus]|uniref:Uncharacterized protein n=1 Tax=Candidatus Saccharicenans subterraneus TaxID=2508984 RepID=A0A3E2BJV0_9BACT|nr:MAG: hypothetical protein OP8BY_1427 [Candidatus Saccharicenans subterraneum]